METTGRPESPAGPGSVEVSIVFPCLNEERAVGRCVRSAWAALTAMGVSGEVIVVDNGSEDNSVAEATAAGARVVRETKRGYGNAYHRGFADARGRYLVMADADATYDLADLPRFIQPLRAGHDMVIGDRFAGGMPAGVMPWHHRYIGNPILSGILRGLFHVKVADAHCGMRSFTRDAYDRMRLRTAGMEYASEMVINAGRARLKVTEVPISYAAREGESKLNSLRDGWRHLRLMLLYSPLHLFFVPGALFFLLGLTAVLLTAGQPLALAGHYWDMHTTAVGGMLALLGTSVVGLGVLARAYALSEGFEDEDRDPLLRLVHRHFTLERGLLAAAVLFLVGAAILGAVFAGWAGQGFSTLAAIRPVILGATLVGIGSQIGFTSCLMALFAFNGRDR